MRPNIILLVMDTARSKTVYSGIQDGSFPTLRRIADEGVTFENAMSTGPWTVPSHASLFTGKYTSEHQTNAASPEFDVDQKVLATHLQECGYCTVGLSANPWINYELGFNRGFDYYRMSWDPFWNNPTLSAMKNTAATENENNWDQLAKAIDQMSIRNAPKILANILYAKFFGGYSDKGASRITNVVTDWISNNGSEDEPFFCFINYLEPHLEYDPPQHVVQELTDSIPQNKLDDIEQDAWRYLTGQINISSEEFSILEQLYRAEIKYIDGKIQDIYECLDRNGILDETAIIVVGDHGENIGDHDLMDHQYCLYDTLLHVPCLIRYPEVYPGGMEMTDLIETRDLFATILELANIDYSADHNTPAHSLLDVENCGRSNTVAEYLTPQPAISELISQFDVPRSSISQYDRALHSIRSAEWKLIVDENGAIELYRIDEDPEENKNVADTYPDIVDRLQEDIVEKKGELRRYSRNADSIINEETEERLKQLGYI
jgi:arylsulfatase A-like enzyme